MIMQLEILDPDHIVTTRLLLSDIKMLPVLGHLADSGAGCLSILGVALLEHMAK